MNWKAGKRLAAGVAAALIGAGVYIAAPASAAGVTYWVDAAAASTGPGTGCGSSAAYTSVQAAVTAAGASDIVEVCPGTYAGPVNIPNGKDNLILRGAKAGIPAGPDENPVNRGTGESVIEVESAAASVFTWGTASNTVIDGFTIRNSRASGTVAGGNGLAISGRPGIQVRNNIVEFTGNPAFVSAQQAGISGSRADGLVIENNSIRGFRYGFNLQSGALTDVPSVFEDNYVSYTFTGFILGASTADGHSFIGNTIVDSAGGGGNGIQLPMVADTTVSGNTITGTGAGTSAYGVWLQEFGVAAGVGSGADISGNTITGYNYGVRLAPNAALPAGSPANEVHDNNLTGNTNYAIFAGSPAIAATEASCNWFGSVNGPIVAPAAGTNRVNGNVNFIPFSTAPNPGGACNGPLPPAPVVRIADAEVLEPASGQSAAFVPVMLDAPATENVTVRYYTVAGSAAGGNVPGAGIDFRNWGSLASPRSVTIPAGSTSATINVPVFADGEAESNESFSVKIASVTGGDYVVAPVDTSTVTIVDADSLGTSNPVINVSNGWAYEGDDGARKIQLYVQLNKPAASDVLVAVGTQDGSAVAGQEYNARSFTMRIPAGTISKTFDVTLLNDTSAESTKSFSVVGAVTGGPLVEELSMTGVGTILDDD